MNICLEDDTSSLLLHSGDAINAFQNRIKNLKKVSIFPMVSHVEGIYTSTKKKHRAANNKTKTAIFISVHVKQILL